MTFTTKKEADHYDKMLDIADHLYEWIESAELQIEEKHLEDLTLYLAQNKDKAISILRGVKPRPKPETEQPKPEGSAQKGNDIDKSSGKPTQKKIKGKIQKKK